MDFLPKLSKHKYKLASRFNSRRGQKLLGLARTDGHVGAVVPPSEHVASALRKGQTTSGEETFSQVMFDKVRRGQTRSDEVRRGQAGSG